MARLLPGVKMPMKQLGQSDLDALKAYYERQSRRSAYGANTGYQQGYYNNNTERERVSSRLSDKHVPGSRHGSYRQSPYGSYYDHRPMSAPVGFGSNRPPYQQQRQYQGYPGSGYGQNSNWQPPSQQQQSRQHYNGYNPGYTNSHQPPPHYSDRRR